jgi:carbonic anhydrase
LSKTREELLAGNVAHVEGFAGAALASPPRRHLAVVTCMDARIDPLAMFGMAAGDMHVMRNAGGRVNDDVIRSLVVSTLAMAVRAVAVVHHTDCGMAKLGNQDLQALVEQVGATTDEDFMTAEDAEHALWLDVATVATSPLLPEGVEVHGFRYDVRSGQLEGM